MSSRSKTRRNNPHLTREEKAEKRIAHAAQVSKEHTPKESIALDIARQNVGLRDHLANPEEYYGLLDTIEHNPQIQNFETYVAFLHHFRGRTKAQTTEILYHLYALRTVEAWKQVAQTYTISAPLLDRTLRSQEPINCEVEELSLPFRAFFVDLGPIADTDQHVGLFVRRRSDAPYLDLVLIKNELFCSLTLNRRVTVTPPALDQCNLDDVSYINYALTAIIQLFSLRNRDPDVEYIYFDDASREHTEWRTHLRLIDEPETSTSSWAYDSDDHLVWRTA